MKDRVRKESPEHLQVKLGCLAEDQEQEGGLSQETSQEARRLQKEPHLHHLLLEPHNQEIRGPGQEEPPLSLLCRH